MEGSFKFLNVEDYRLLSSKMQLARVPAGKYLIRENTPPSGLMIVRSGEVEVRRDLHGHEVHVGFLQKGQIIGESSFLVPAPASASVVARDDVEIMFFTPAKIEPLFQENPGLFGRFYQSIAWNISRRVRNMTEKLGAPVGNDPFADVPDWEII